ncbi:hypothetical protein IV203_020040 [Nitzschia inconspicua]|uniref:Uncharacterized protein n=1 Tax=Nitzschia inconspicua TaxID=303405 RepID=A0A9K3Q5U3_9STRA|nr:hypothetical protein IV203_020040 [Nitzschia inconspicua]
MILSLLSNNATTATKAILCKATSSTTSDYGVALRRYYMSSSTKSKSWNSVRSRSSSSSSSKSKRPPVDTSSSSSSSSSSLEGVWYTPQHGTPSNSLDMGKYGLKRIDYSKLMENPPVWTLPPHPPTKSVQERVLFPLTLLIVAGLGLWAYLNPEEEDMKDYWKRVETGQILVDDDDDEWEDDDDDDDDDE